MLGGGVRMDVSPSSSDENWGRVLIQESFPDTPTSWKAIVRIVGTLNNSADRARAHAFVVCGS
jgi:hypothetical protein